MVANKYAVFYKNYITQTWASWFLKTPKNEPNIFLSDSCYSQHQWLKSNQINQIKISDFVNVCSIRVFYSNRTSYRAARCNVHIYNKYARCSMWCSVRINWTVIYIWAYINRIWGTLWAFPRQPGHNLKKGPRYSLSFIDSDLLKKQLGKSNKQIPRKMKRNGHTDDGRTDERTNGRTDERTNERTGLKI